MTVAYEAYGPYTAEDLHALPEEGKRYELVDGWLIELPPSTPHNTPHNMVVQALFQILYAAVVAAGVDVSLSAGCGHIGRLDLGSGAVGHRSRSAVSSDRPTSRRVVRSNATASGPDRR